jgi:hypothetical protein
MVFLWFSYGFSYGFWAQDDPLFWRHGHGILATGRPWKLDFGWKLVVSHHGILMGYERGYNGI